MVKLIGVYGSLKRGCYNNDPNWPLVRTTTIRGAMTSNGVYPRLYKPTEENQDLVRNYELQILEVSEEDFQVIDNMEQLAGYYSELIGDYVVWWSHLPLSGIYVEKWP